MRPTTSPTSPTRGRSRSTSGRRRSRTSIILIISCWTWIHPMKTPARSAPLPKPPARSWNVSASHRFSSPPVHAASISGPRSSRTTISQQQPAPPGVWQRWSPPASPESRRPSSSSGNAEPAYSSTGSATGGRSPLPARIRCGPARPPPLPSRCDGSNSGLRSHPAGTSTPSPIAWPIRPRSRFVLRWTSTRWWLPRRTPVSIPTATTTASGAEAQAFIRPGSMIPAGRSSADQSGSVSPKRRRMDMDSDRTGLTRILVGGAIVVAGLLLLLGRLIDLDLGALWPLFVLIPGVVMLVSGLAAAPGGSGTAATVTGSQLTGLGLLLLFQNLTGWWQTWAYGWALVWPTSIGLGLAARGALSGDDDTARNGRNTAFVGFVIFLVGFLFFEGILNISGSSLGTIGDYALPAVLIGAGLIIIVRRKR